MSGVPPSPENPGGTQRAGAEHGLNTNSFLDSVIEFATSPEAYYQQPAEQEPLHAVKKSSRREFLRILGLSLVSSAAGIGIAVVGINSLRGGDEDEVAGPSDSLAPTTAPTTSALPSQTTLEVKPTVPLSEAVVQPETGIDYSLNNIFNYVRTTHFGDFKVYKLEAAFDSIAESDTLAGGKDYAADIVRMLTGVPMIYNINPSTLERDQNTGEINLDSGKAMENNRKGIPDKDYLDKISSFVKNVSRLPHLLASLPRLYDVFEEYRIDSGETSDGRDSVNTNIGGQVSQEDILVMDRDNLWSNDVLLHELMHIYQFLSGPNYAEDSDYARIRAYGREHFGSVSDMTASLTATLDAGNMPEDIYDLAYSLVLHEDSTPDARFEDAAYTLNTTMGRGLLPAGTNFEIVDYLRSKQMQVIADMSKASGIDFSAHIAMEYHFGNNVHPLTLAEIAQAISPDQISEYEGGILGKEDRWARQELAPETMIVNIGTAEAPELITLYPRFLTQGGSDGSEVGGWYDIYLSVPSPIQPETITPSTVGVEFPPSVSLIADKVLTTLAPQLKDTSPMVYDDTSPISDLRRIVAPDRKTYRLAINAIDIEQKIDPKRVVGVIGKNGQFRSGAQ